MVRAVLVVATIVDLGLAALLIAVSGFILGPGPESMHGEPWTTAGWVAMLIGCVVAPIAGFVLNARHKTGIALVVAWLPPAVALIAVSIPPPY
jgi:hypothetical protein